MSSNTATSSHPTSSTQMKTYTTVHNTSDHNISYIHILRLSIVLVLSFSFAYAPLKVVKGSAKLFKALLSRCLSRDVVAVCRYIPRQNAQPFFVALLPQAEKLDTNNMQVASPGFHVIFLPFSEDFRALHIEECPKGIIGCTCTCVTIHSCSIY